jgi:DNA polymerase-1
MAEQKRLFLLDAYALIFRGYYAFIKNPRINSKGLDTSAILGFTNSLLDVIKRERPDHIAVCFDKGGSKDRVEIFKEYKANRDATPEFNGGESSKDLFDLNLYYTIDESNKSSSNS